ncbi:AraC family transcriptional regulator [Alcanivorax sp. S71-1-4]|uniref:AraC family transcriptional regulator n=1 Tax=Alcanivorax sp. S71-1-4 TaxID=1177159 RepID=UPI00135AE3E5|nr:AraC family transcriptional regulator [Alcanivorax sp. S71-1-4]KAF0810305.1 AraC family transcriptional regulator [Alcanivorax sp. S71-1-4]
MWSNLLPASVLPGLLELAMKGRLNIQAMFERVGIDPDSVGRRDQYISLAQLDAVLSEAFTAVEHEPFFGLRVGRDNHYGNLDLLGNLMATANTLGEALTLLLHYKNLMVPYMQLSLDQVDGGVRLAGSSDGSLNFTRLRAHNEAVVATMVAIGRSLTGDRLGLLAVEFCHSAPPDTAPYDEYFAVPQRFDQPENAILVQPQTLNLPLAGAYPDYHQRLRRQADRLLASLSRAQGMAMQVRNVLAQRLGGDDTAIADVAAALNLSARTLQRRLRQENVSFAGLRDAVRHDYARHALLADDCDMEQLATDLGFSDIANFYHAFKRWEGCAPGEYRRRHR